MAESRKSQKNESKAPEATALDGLQVADTRTPEANYLTRDNIVPSGASPAYIQAAIRGAAEKDDVKRSPHAGVDEILLTLSDADREAALKAASPVSEA